VQSDPSSSIILGERHLDVHLVEFCVPFVVLANGIRLDEKPRVYSGWYIPCEIPPITSYFILYFVYYIMFIVVVVVVVVGDKRKGRNVKSETCIYN